MAREYSSVLARARTRPVRPAGPREWPMLFSAPMVRALLEGTKTETRRVVTSANSDTAAPWAELDFTDAYVDPGGTELFGPGPYLKVKRPSDDTRHRVYPRVQVGDRLWVRETWRTVERASDSVDGVLFRADGAFVPIANTKYAANRWVEDHRREDKWRPSIFLKRWASRITLEVTEVRVQCLQDISETDVRAEGVTLGVPLPAMINGVPGTVYVYNPRKAYALLWDRINGKRPGSTWGDNPWVWVLTFKVLEQGGT